MQPKFRSFKTLQDELEFPPINENPGGVFSVLYGVKNSILYESKLMYDLPIL